MTARVVLALLVTCASFAQAGSRELEQAKSHFKLGKQFQEVGEYAKAAAEYKLAFDLDPRPELLFDIAQAYRLADLTDDATQYYQRYLDAQPNGPGADDARKQIALLAKRQADEKREPKPLVLTPDYAKVIILPVAPGVRERMVPASKPLRITGLALAGLGALAIGIGVKYSLDASDDAGKLSRFSGTWTFVEEQIYDDGQRADHNAKIAYLAGGITLAAGGALFWFGSRTQFVPIVSPHAAGATAWLRF